MCFAAKRCAAGVGDAEAGLCLLWEGWAPAGYVQKSVGPSALRRSRRESRLIDWDQHSPLPPSLAPPLQPTPPPSSPPLLHLLLLLLVCSCTGSTFACLHHPFPPPHPPPAAAIPSSLFLHTQTCFITHTPFSPAERVQQRGGKTRYFNKINKKKDTGMGGDGDACATDAHNGTGTCERTRRDPNVWVNSGQRITGLCSVLTS